MPKGTCKIDGCERAAYCRGWCSTHYQRWRVSGDAGPAAIPYYQYPARQPCIVDGCEELQEARGWCHTHYSQWRRTGSPHASPPRKGPDHPQWKGSDIGYLGMHHRIRRAKGKAEGYDCVSCGGRARDWAYDHEDPAELIETRVGEQFGMSYSLDMNHYQPMCKACHNRFDQTG